MKTVPRPVMPPPSIMRRRGTAAASGNGGFNHAPPSAHELLRDQPGPTKTPPSHQQIRLTGPAHRRRGRPTLRLDQGPRRPPDKWFIAEVPKLGLGTGPRPIRAAPSPAPVAAASDLAEKRSAAATTTAGTMTANGPRRASPAAARALHSGAESLAKLPGACIPAASCSCRRCPASRAAPWAGPLLRVWAVLRPAKEARSTRGLGSRGCDNPILNQRRPITWPERMPRKDRGGVQAVALSTNVVPALLSWIALAACAERSGDIKTTRRSPLLGAQARLKRQGCEPQWSQRVVA